MHAVKGTKAMTAAWNALAPVSGMTIATSRFSLPASLATCCRLLAFWLADDCVQKPIKKIRVSRRGVNPEVLEPEYNCQCEENWYGINCSESANPSLS